MVLYLATTGTAPLALVNSLLCYSQTRADTTVDRLVFIASKDNPRRFIQGSIRSIPGIIQGFLNDVENLPNGQFSRELTEILTNVNIDSTGNITGNKSEFCDIIPVDEVKIQKISKTIKEYVLKSPPTEQTEVILDMTAGRKAMSAAAVIVALDLYREHHFDVEVVYYWLFDYSKINLLFSQLGYDDYELISIYKSKEGSMK